MNDPVVYIGFSMFLLSLPFLLIWFGYLVGVAVGEERGRDELIKQLRKNKVI